MLWGFYIASFMTMQEYSGVDMLALLPLAYCPGVSIGFQTKRTVLALCLANMVLSYCLQWNSEVFFFST